jgi:hypothetical protein
VGQDAPAAAAEIQHSAGVAERVVVGGEDVDQLLRVPATLVNERPDRRACTNTRAKQEARDWTLVPVPSAPPRNADAIRRLSP